MHSAVQGVDRTLEVVLKVVANALCGMCGAWVWALPFPSTRGPQGACGMCGDWVWVAALPNHTRPVGTHWDFI